MMKRRLHNLLLSAALAYIVLSAARHFAAAPDHHETLILRNISVAGMPVQLLEESEAVEMLRKSGYGRSEKMLSHQLGLVFAAGDSGEHETLAYCSGEVTRIGRWFEEAFHSRYFSLLFADILPDERKLRACAEAQRCISRCREHIRKERGRDAEVETILGDTFAELKRAGCDRWAGKGFASLADHYFAVGRDDEGLRCLEEALDRYQSTDHLALVSHLSGRIGAFHVRKGNFEAAEAAHQLSLRSAQRLGDPYYVSRALSFLGCLRATEGFVIEAESLLVRSCRYSELASDPTSTIARQIILARLLNSFGEADRAAAIAEKSTLLAERLASGESPDVGTYSMATTKHYLASGLALLSRIQCKKGLLDDAIRNMEKALSIAQKGIDRHFIAELEKQLGDTYAAAGRTEEAFSCFERALAVANKLHENRRVAEYMTAMARLYFDHSRYGEAEELLETALQLAAEEYYWMQEVESCHLLGQAKIARGNRGEGRKLLAGAIELFEEESQKKPHVEDRHALRELVESIHDDLICLESETPNRVDSLLFWIERSRHAEPASRPISSRVLEDSIRACIADRAWIPEGVLVIQPAITPDRLILVALNRSGAIIRCIDMEGARLERDVRAFSDRCLGSDTAPHPYTSARRGDDIAEIASRLYEVLIEPIEPLVESAEFLCFLPDGMLRFLPLGALVQPVSGRFLLESKTILFSHSLLDLRGDGAMSGTPGHRGGAVGSGSAGETRGPRFETPLLIGNVEMPELARRMYPHLDTLHHAGREMRQLRRFFETATVLEGFAATKQAALECIECADMIHISCHTISFPMHSGRTSLLLSSPDEISSERELSAALLGDEEISRFDLSRVRLVVLAACESVYGSMGTSRTGLGLAGAFVRSGAGTVVGSLWPIEDAAAERAVTSFYRHLRSGTASPIEAIHAVQRECIEENRTAGDHFENMQTWAPLTCYGSIIGASGRPDVSSNHAGSTPQDRKNR